MHNLLLWIKKITVTMVMVSTVTLFTLPTTSFAAGPEGPVGPQGTVGTVGPVGTQGVVGPQGEVGVITPTTEVTQTNTNTGPDSTNNSSVDTSTTVDADTTNEANLNNDVDVSGNTGGIDVSGNTSVGSVATGDMNATINIVNAANSTFADGSTLGTQTFDGSNSNGLIFTPGQNRSSLSNTNTGPNSTNTLDNTSTTVINGALDNTANINNNVQVQGNTGDVVLDGNTHVDGLQTGDIGIQANFLNIANLFMPNTILEVDMVSVLNGLNGDIVISDAANQNTGPDSINTATTNVNDTTNIAIDQNADIDNAITVNSNTGEDTLDGNSTVGSYETGDTTVVSRVTNIANQISQPVLYIFNVFGTWAGEILGLNPDQVIVNQMNDQTGPDSTNQADVNVNREVNLDVNNEANVTNNLVVNANTGGNKVTNNSEVGSVKTGDVSVAASFTNLVNGWSNDMGRVLVRVFNIFGNWNGNVTTTPVVAQNNTNAGTTTQPTDAPTASPVVNNHESSVVMHSVPTATSHQSSRAQVAPRASTAKRFVTATFVTTTQESTEPNQPETAVDAIATTSRGSGLVPSAKAAESSTGTAASRSPLAGYGIAGTIVALWGAVEFATRRKR